MTAPPSPPPSWPFAQPAWLHLIGMGENGLDGLHNTARTLIAQAALVMGGARHLALAAPLIRGQALAWPRPITDGMAMLHQHHQQHPHAPAVVLASGDPFWFGIGRMIAAAFNPGEWRALPAVSCLSLACARLGWSLQDCTVLSFCGRPIAAARRWLQPGGKLLALSADADTPAAFAALLRDAGWGQSCLYILEALGGPHERLRTLPADTMPFPTDIAGLNLVAAMLVAGPAATAIPFAPGLPDALFEHDGQITKSDIRAMTLAALRPGAGAVLWDIGAGSGSIGIEWMLCHPRNQAVAFEAVAARAARIGRNAAALGTPGLRVVHATAPAALAGLPAPDAVFVGGGVAAPGLIEAAWTGLRPGGRIAANAVTLPAETRLIAAQSQYGGTLVRIRLEHLDRIGPHPALRPALPILQWRATKPC